MMNMLCGASFLRGVGIVFHDNCGRCESRCALGTIHGYRFRGGLVSLSICFELPSKSEPLFGVSF